MKIGACRHGTKCSRSHIVPDVSKTILLKNFYCGVEVLLRPDAREGSAQRQFESFYKEVYNEITEQYGDIEEMIVSDNVGEHMVGNVYIKFYEEAEAQAAVDDLNNRWFDGKPIHCEFSPVKDFKAACCRQHDFGECERGKFCNFLHLKKVTAVAKKKLSKRREKTLKKRIKMKICKQTKRKEDNSVPKRYQSTSSSEEPSSSSSESEVVSSESSTPNAFREDRYPSDVSSSDSDPDPIITAHMQTLRKQKWVELQSKLGIQAKWDEDRERNFVFSLL